MKVVDIPTVIRDNPKGTTFSKDLFIYHGGWHNQDGNINYRLDALCVCIVEQGFHRTTLNSKEHMVKKGDVLVCHPNDFYTNLFFSENFYATFIYANLDLISHHITSLEIREVLMKLKVNPVLKLDSEQEVLIWSYIKILRLKKTCGQRNDSTSVILTAKALLIELFSLIKNEPLSYGIENTSQPALLYQKFIDLLVSLTFKPHEMAFYASELAVTPKYLSQVCKAQSGKTANEWIRDYIMNDAHRYLTSSDFTIKEIASRLGFSNFSFFCQSVKRFWGKTPLQIRNSNT